MAKDEWDWKEGWGRIENYLNSIAPDSGKALLVQSPTERALKLVGLGLIYYVLFDYRICVACSHNAEGYTPDDYQIAKSHLKHIHDILGLEEP